MDEDQEHVRNIQVGVDEADDDMKEFVYACQQSVSSAEEEDDDDDDGMDVSIASTSSTVDQDNASVMSDEEDDIEIVGDSTNTSTDSSDVPNFINSDDQLNSLPINLVREIASFLPINDMTSTAMTCATMYSQKLDFQPLKSSTFCLIQEDRLPTDVDFRSTSEPFKFLFQTALYGMIQVEFSLVNPPSLQARQQQQPRLQHFFGPEAEATDKLEEVRVRINVQKKFPLEHAALLANKPYSPKVIFRLDQSLPGCSFHFDSKYVCNHWKAGHLSYLVYVCATRISRALQADNNTTAHPPADKILRKFQADMRDNVLRCIRNQGKEAVEKEP